MDKKNKENLEEFIREWGGFTSSEAKVYPFCYIDVLCLVKEAYEKGACEALKGKD